MPSTCGTPVNEPCLTPKGIRVYCPLNRFAKPVSRPARRGLSWRPRADPGSGSTAVDRAPGAAPEVAVEERTRRRPRIADVAREAGVSKTAVSFAFNSPDRLAPETATRIRDRRRLARLPAAPGRPDADPARRRGPSACSRPRRCRSSSPTRSSGRSREGVALAAEQEGYALHFISPLHGSLARAMDRATVDGVVADRPVGAPPGGRADPRRRPAAGHGRLERPARPADVEIDDEGGARAAAEHLHRPRPSRRAGRRHRAAVSPGVGMELEGVRAAAHARLPRRVRGGRHRAPGRRSVVAPATHRGRHRGPAPGLGGRAAAHRRARDVGRDGDRRPARRPRARPARAARTCRSSGFDDIDISQHTNPPLTTVHQPIRLKGETRRPPAAGDDRGPRRGGRPAVRLETRLIIRGSTGPAPRAAEPGRSTARPPCQPPALRRGSPESASTRRRTDRTEESMHES